MGNIPCCEQSHKKNDPQIKPYSLDPQHNSNKSVSYLKSQSQKNGAVSSRNNDESKPENNEPSKRKENARGPENYQSKRYLGKGAFGCVALAEDKETGKQYAMKIIQKAKIREFNVLQCQIISRIGHPDFLTSIRETFQNQQNIYIIMQFLPMGDLYFYLKKKEIPFTQQVIRGIIAEIVVGIGILHNYGLVYRQLKPENLLITTQGHIKLTDYGLSKIIIEEKQSISTFVGTLEYMAPEVLEGDFGQKADIWSLGILMFELMFRENPFEENQRKADFFVEDYKTLIDKNLINEKINGKIGHMSLSFRDLLLKLLQKNPDKRISLQQIKRHDFFKQIDWSEIESRKNPPPLSEIIEKQQSINFREVFTEQYYRRAIAKHRTINNNYDIQLYEFRNSQ